MPQDPLTELGAAPSLPRTPLSPIFLPTHPTLFPPNYQAYTTTAAKITVGLLSSVTTLAVQVGVWETCGSSVCRWVVWDMT